MNKLFTSLLLFFFAAVSAHAAESVNEKRLHEVEERGKHVMPFDLEKTIHVFSKTNRGGIQQVIAKDRSDSEQINLIRGHLLEIFEDFRQGGFSKPTQIHGEEMPGLAELKSANPGQIKIEYAELPDGAQISYSSPSPKFIKAIHQWFDAQLRDHARHAVPGHSH